jgi:hypothetical protein
MNLATASVVVDVEVAEEAVAVDEEEDMALLAEAIVVEGEGADAAVIVEDTAAVVEAEVAATILTIKLVLFLE